MQVLKLFGFAGLETSRREGPHAATPFRAWWVCRVLLERERKRVRNLAWTSKFPVTPTGRPCDTNSGKEGNCVISV